MSDVTYNASVYKRTVKYTNFKGETKSVDLEFALSPIELMRVIAQVPNAKKSKSKNPALRGQDEGISDEQQLKFLVDIASKAAGESSADGESWDPIPDFNNLLAGQAFITKLASSDGDRMEFAQKVLIDPFKAFVDFAAADEGNSEKEIQDFRQMLSQMERIFSVSPKRDGESLDERRARLEAEIAALSDGTDEV